MPTTTSFPCDPCCGICKPVAACSTYCNQFSDRSFDMNASDSQGGNPCPPDPCDCMQFLGKQVFESVNTVEGFVLCKYVLSSIFTRCLKVNPDDPHGFCNRFCSLRGVLSGCQKRCCPGSSVGTVFREAFNTPPVCGNSMNAGTCTYTGTCGSLYGRFCACNYSYNP